MPVIAALEFKYQVALGEPASRADRGHGRFGPGADKADALDRRQRPSDLLAQLDFERREHSVAGPARGLVGDGRHNIRVRVAKNHPPPGTNVTNLFPPAPAER